MSDIDLFNKLVNDLAKHDILVSTKEPDFKISVYTKTDEYTYGNPHELQAFYDGLTVLEGKLTEAQKCVNESIETIN